MSHSYSSNAHSSDLQHEEPRERDFRGIADETLALHGRDCHASNHGFEAVKVGGVEDHAHALVHLLPTLPFAKAVQVLKSCSSKWINDTKAAGRDFAWQEDTVPSA
jgi:Transposase IS200 like